MEVKEKSILSGETESSHESFIKKFEYIKQSEVKVRGRIDNIKFIQEKYNLVAVNHNSDSIKLFDYNLAKMKEESLVYSSPILELSTHKAGEKLVSVKYRI